MLPTEQTDSVSNDAPAQAGAVDVSGGVTPETQPAETAPQAPQSQPQYVTLDQLSEYEQRVQRSAQSLVDKMAARLLRQLGGTPEERLATIAQKHNVQIPEASRQAFIEEARRQGLLATEPADNEPAEQTPQSGQDMSAWEQLAVDAGLQPGDPEAANLYPHLYRSPAEYSRAIIQAGKAASARRAANPVPAQPAPVQPQPRKAAPVGAAALFPQGGQGKTKDRPSASDAQRAFLGD